MSIHSQKQKGSAFIIIVVIIAVSISGILGYALWSNFFVSKDTTQKVASEPIQDSSSTAQDTSKGYLVIDDWKVKFRLTDSLATTKVLYYSRTTQDSSPQNDYAFTTSRIQSLGGKCAEKPFGDTVILYRYQEKPIAVPDGELVNETALGGYYYVLTSPIASCSGFNDAGEMQSPSAVEISDGGALKESIRKLESSE